MTYKNCQSCGMPLKKLPNGGGNNTDGSTSKKYCAYCFVDGEFTQPDWSVDQMNNFVKAKMNVMGFPGFLASFFTQNIVKLERWKTRQV
ncbi:MAG: hypothetical protein COA58_10655 [Bacteroidetes bacterium]|nr:MAG: hypothetical protein COA58_10655 [Bacteroidota bacterium]